MAKISELKEIIIELRMDLVRASIPHGHCPYVYYTPKIKRDVECGDVGCSACRRQFMEDMEKDIRKEVRSL